MSYQTDLLNNRLYSSLLPDVNDIVMVQIIDIDDATGAKCKLLEYGEIDGFVPINEFSKHRIKSMKQIFQKGLTYPLQVIRVEENKGYVDLSKKHVTPTEIKDCLKRYKEAKAADSILQRAATLCRIPKIEIYEKCIWPLCTFSITHDISGERITAKVFHQQLEQNVNLPTDLNVSNDGSDEDRPIRSALEVLEFLIKMPSIIDPFGIDQSLKNMLIQLSTKKLQQKRRKISATIQLTCFGNGGISSIKKVLSKGLMFGQSQIDQIHNEQEISTTPTNTTSTTSDQSANTDNIASSIENTHENTIVNENAHETIVNENAHKTIVNENAHENTIVNENVTNNEHNEEDEQIVINIFSVGCPDYELTLETKDIEKGIDLLQKVMEHMIDESKSEEGMNLSIKTPPHTIGE